MPRWCGLCGRKKHKGLCDLVQLTNGKTVHASRVDDYMSDVHEDILSGKVKVVNRWIKKKDEKLA